MNYNLLEEQWIPVLWTDGKYGRVSIMDALTKAGRIRQIAASNPMDRIAILRFLLALLYWCKGNPPGGRSADSGDPFPADWFSKLDENKDCFNLLGDGKRFYQYSASAKKLSANYLIHEIPTGTNMLHFRHSKDKENGLCPACCAMGLLRLPLFATSGGKGKSPGINLKPPIYVMPVGISLAETMRLSWRQVSNFGTPAWEKPDFQLPLSGEVPILMGLTWLPRRVWLDNPKEPESVCISCGRKEGLIQQCVFAGIGSAKTDEGGQGREWSDPHVIYEQNRKGDVISIHASNVLGASDAAAGQWAKIVAGLVRNKNAFANIIDAWVVGFATVQNDKYLEAMEYVIPFSFAPHQFQESIEKIEMWQKEGSKFVRKLRPRNQKTISRKHVEIQSIVAAIRPHVEARVSAKVGKLLTGGEDAWEQAAREYGPMMDVIAKSLSPGYTAAVLQRRKEIAGVTPDMRPKTKGDKNYGQRKGGDK